MCRNRGTKFIYNYRGVRSVPLPLLFSVVIFTIIISLLSGLALGNTARRQYLQPQANEVLQLCESDPELTGCHVEWVYDGMVLMEFDVVGQSKQVKYSKGDL